ncbi:MAG: hypothetical protein N2050_06020, partial [Flavobacteriales bacterium]|nr:hypothetical protein [Flavobacteriales bacterium]
MTSASPITAPASGLLVFNTNASVTGGSGVGFYVWLGSGWTRLDMSNSGDWRLTGNSGTSPATNYLGTSDATDLSIRTNATERIRVTSSGTVRLNSYTTNNVIKTSGGDGTLTVGAVNLASSEVTGVLPVANGGTGVNSIPANGVVLGNGTSPITTVAPGAAGNVLMSDGTTWTSNDGSGQFIRNQNSADQTANFRITGTGRANTSFQSPLYTRADAGTVAIRPNTNSTTAIQLQNAGGTSILNVDATNSRVGIGTTAPTRPLQVSATGVQQIAAVHPSNVDNTEPAEVFFDRSAVASTQVAAVGMSGTARDFFIWVNGADRVTITETGNVGIGTTAPAYLLDVADRMRVRTGGSGSAGIWYNNMDNSGLVAFTGTMDNNLWGIWGLGINDWHFRFNRNSGNMSAGPVNPSATVGHPKLTVTRDGMAACCGGEDATLALADNTQSTGRRASISFHNGGEAEGVVRLIQNTINGVTSRRLQLYDNQSSGLGLEIGGSGGVVGRFWYGLSGSRTERRDNAGLQGNAGAQSGMFETDNPTNYPSGASSWWHLLDVRHSNPANNYAMQFAGSFYDQRFFARKTN